MSNFLLGLFVAWFGRRALAAMDWVFDFWWGWWRASPQLRLYAFTRAHTLWMERTLKQIESGELRDRKQVEWMKRFHLWCDTHLDKWEARVRSGSRQ